MVLTGNHTLLDFKASSFPRRRESRINEDSFFYWIPACAGMTEEEALFLRCVSIGQLYAILSK